MYRQRDEQIDKEINKQKDRHKKDINYCSIDIKQRQGDKQLDSKHERQEIYND